jgi:hypothetical protein
VGTHLISYKFDCPLGIIEKLKVGNGPAAGAVSRKKHGRSAYGNDHEHNKGNHDLNEGKRNLIIPCIHIHQ